MLFLPTTAPSPSWGGHGHGHSPPVTALELQRSIYQRINREVRGHNEVLARCYGKIRRAGGLNGMSCMFEVPEFVMGFPPYDVAACVLHVMASLERNGFGVTYVFPRFLVISWDLEARRSAAPPPAIPGSSQPIPIEAQRYLALQSQPQSQSPSPIRPLAPHPPTGTTFRPIVDFQPSRTFFLNS